MKVFLLKSVERIGIEGEIIDVSDGFAMNYIIPRKFGIQITAANESHYKNKIKTVEKRKEVIATETSLLAEKIKNLDITIKRKMHDAGKLFGALSAGEIVDELLLKGVSVAKNQVVFDKSIKTKGEHEVVIKLSSKLQPVLKVRVLAE